MRFRGLVRVGAACALVFAQLAAFTGAAGCPCESPDMASMPGMPGAEAHHMPANGTVPHRAPCPHPMAPGGCAMVASCATGAVIARPALAPVAPVAAPAVFAAAASAPRSVTRAPDPPPPRA